MHTRFIVPSVTLPVIPSTTRLVGNVGHVTLESMSALPLVFLAWGQKPQLAEHFSFRHINRYIVVGLASILPFSNPSTMAEPAETRIFSERPASVIEYPEPFCDISLVILGLYLSHYKLAGCA